jgi:hypothetical protein
LRRCLSATAAVGKIADEYFALIEQARTRAVWVINPTYAKNLSKLLDVNSRRRSTSHCAAFGHGGRRAAVCAVGREVTSTRVPNTAVRRPRAR